MQMFPIGKDCYVAGSVTKRLLNELSAAMAEVEAMGGNATTLTNLRSSQRMLSELR
jgi:hypothetical protein